MRGFRSTGGSQAPDDRGGCLGEVCDRAGRAKAVHGRFLDRGKDGPKANARDEQRAHEEQVKESQAMILDLLSERDVLKKWAVPGEVRDGQEGTVPAGWCGLARKQRSCAERVGRVPCGGPIC